MTTRRRIQIGVLGLAAIFVLWAGYFIFRSSFIATDGRRYFSLFDDAMISMRYAWNLSHGAGLVWNPGERVEGYTNLLMVVLMSVWTGLLDKSSAVLAVQLTGIPILLGIAALGFQHWLELSRGNDVLHRNGFASLAFMGCLLYYPLAYWTLMGMETGLLTLFLLTGSLALLRHIRTGRFPELAGGAVALGLAYLTRPDSAPFAALMLVTAPLLGRVGDRGRLHAVVSGLAIYLVFPMLQTGFRAFYYGELVPVTYTLKMTGMPLGVRVENGLGFIRPFLGQVRWAFLLAFVGGIAGFSKRRVFLLIPPLMLVAYQVLIGGDAWSYWRLVAPAIPYVVLLALSGADWLIGSLVRHPRPRPQGLAAVRGRPFARSLAKGSHRLSWIVALVAAALIFGALTADLVPLGSSGFGYTQRSLLLGGFLFAFLVIIAQEQPARHLVGFAVVLFVLGTSNRAFLQEAVLFRLPYQVENNKNHVDVALSINRYTTQDASVGVVWAGIIPYYTSRYAIDFLGKNDPYIASLEADMSGSVAWSGMSSVPGHNKYDLEYSILERRPTYVERFNWGSEDLTPILRNLYVEVSLPGPDPAFLRGDPAVRWDIIPPDKLLLP